MKRETIGLLGILSAALTCGAVEVKWNVTTGGAVDDAANYAGKALPTSDDWLYLRYTQTAPITMDGNALTAYHVLTERWKPFVGELALGAGKSLLSKNQVFISCGSNFHLTSGCLGVAPTTVPSHFFEIGGDYNNGNSFIVDGPDARVTTSCAVVGNLVRGAMVFRANENGLFKIINGGAFQGTFDAFNSASSKHNTMLVSDTDSSVLIPYGTVGSSGSGDFRWGQNGSENIICISNQATLACLPVAPVYVGIASTAGAGASNRLAIVDRASASFGGNLVLGWNTLGSRLDVTDGAKLYLTNNNLLCIGGKGSVGTVARFADNAKLVLTDSKGGFYVGYGYSTNAELRIESGSEICSTTSERSFRVGHNGYGSRLIVNGGTLNVPNACLDQGYETTSEGSSIVVCNGGLINAMRCNLGLVGKNHTVAVTNGTLTCGNNAITHFGGAGGKNSVLSIGGTNSWVYAHNTITFAGNCTLNIHVPKEGYYGQAKKWAPIDSDSGFKFADKTTINLSADEDYLRYDASKARRRVVVMKVSGTAAIDLTNVDLRITSAPAGTKIDTSVKGEIALTFHKTGLSLLIR